MVGFVTPNYRAHSLVLAALGQSEWLETEYYGSHWNGDVLTTVIRSYER